MTKAKFAVTKAQLIAAAYVVDPEVFEVEIPGEDLRDWFAEKILSGASLFPDEWTKATVTVEVSGSYTATAEDYDRTTFDWRTGLRAELHDRGWLKAWNS